MSHSITTVSPFTGPISSDWTIEELLDWLAEDDDRLSDAGLRKPLLVLEEALTGRHWATVPKAAITGIRDSRSPAIVSLVRSIALHSRAHPALRARTLADVTSGASASLSNAQTIGAEDDRRSDQDAGDRAAGRAYCDLTGSIVTVVGRV